MSSPSSPTNSHLHKLASCPPPRSSNARRPNNLQRHLQISSHPSSFCQLPEVEGKTKKTHRRADLQWSRSKGKQRERERQTWKPWKKIKTVCLLCFFGILQVTAGEEGKKRGSRNWPTFLPGLSCGGAWTYALPVAEARGETRRHCSCGCRRPSLQFLEFRDYFVIFKLCNVIFV